jgi:hypothetical protein
MSTNNQSESIVKLMTALSAFQGNCPNVPKTKTNPHLKNKYAGLEDIMGTIRNPLREAGLVVSQLPGDGTLTTLLAHFESGEFVKSTISLAPVKDNNPQAVGSALTYARRYALSAVLGLAIGEDDDDGHKAAQPASAKPKGNFEDNAAALAIGKLIETEASADNITEDERAKMSTILRANWIGNNSWRKIMVDRHITGELTLTFLKNYLLDDATTK